MYLHKKIKNLRDKPQHVKEGILIFCMVIFVSVVITIWYFNFDANLRLNETSNIISNLKGYFSSSNNLIFNQNGTDEMIKKNVYGFTGEKVSNSLDLNAGTSTETGTSTEIQTTTSTIIETSTNTHVKLGTSTKVK